MAEADRDVVGSATVTRLAKPVPPTFQQAALYSRSHTQGRHGLASLHCRGQTGLPDQSLSFPSSRKLYEAICVCKA